jgi:two-component system cell cycle sensor histidine kinase PleC
VLEPFGQVRPGVHQAHAGTGLGLSLSKMLTELHGGILSIESELDKGTTVTLRFSLERTVAA